MSSSLLTLLFRNDEPLRCISVMSVITHLSHLLSHLKVHVVHQVKLVLPHSTASMIFGKSGEYVARIQMESAARVQVLPKNEDSSLQESVITVQGKCREMLLVVNGNT